MLIRFRKRYCLCWAQASAARVLRSPSSFAVALSAFVVELNKADSIRELSKMQLALTSFQRYLQSPWREAARALTACRDLRLWSRMNLPRGDESRRRGVFELLDGVEDISRTVSVRNIGAGRVI